MNQGASNRQEFGGYQDAVASLIATFESNKPFFAARIAELYQQLSNEVRYCRRLLHAGKQTFAHAQLQENLFRLFGVRVHIPSGRQLSVLAGIIRHVLVAGADMHRHVVERGGAQLLVNEVGRQSHPAIASGKPDLLALDDKLVELSAWFPQGTCVLELRYFARLGLRDIAAELEVDTEAIRRDIRLAKAWLIASCA
jgi:hypothetical protein